MTAKSSTKITIISTPRKLPAINLAIVWGTTDIYYGTQTLFLLARVMYVYNRSDYYIVFLLEIDMVQYHHIYARKKFWQNFII